MLDVDEQQLLSYSNFRYIFTDLQVTINTTRLDASSVGCQWMLGSSQQDHSFIHMNVVSIAPRAATLAKPEVVLHYRPSSGADKLLYRCDYDQNPSDVLGGVSHALPPIQLVVTQILGMYFTGTHTNDELHCTFSASFHLELQGK